MSRCFISFGLLASGLALMATLSGVACSGDGTPATATIAAPKDITLSDSDNGKTVEVQRGASVVITLGSNPTTGFRWTVDSLPAPYLAQLGEAVFIQKSPTPGLVGAGGVERLTFAAQAAGTGQLRLIYHRTFEPGVPPLSTFEVTVTVK